MKTNFTTITRTSVLISLLVIGFTLSAVAQKTSEKIYPGYVVSVEGDTINGNIQMLSPAMNEVKVKMTDRAGNKRTFKASDLVSYSFVYPKYNHNTRSYDNIHVFYVKKDVSQAPIPFTQKQALIERPVSGTLNLYNYYVEREGDVDFHTKHHFLLEQGTTNKLLELNRANFTATLKRLTADNPTLSKKIGTKGYGFKHIPQIITAYNKWFKENMSEANFSPQAD